MVTNIGERLPRRGIKKYKCHVVGSYGKDDNSDPNATVLRRSFSVSVSGICDYTESLLLWLHYLTWESALFSWFWVNQKGDYLRGPNLTIGALNRQSFLSLVLLVIDRIWECEKDPLLILRWRGPSERRVDSLQELEVSGWNPARSQGLQAFNPKELNSTNN